MGRGEISIELSSDEALVLFDWIRRFNDSGPRLEDQAEQRVLWNMEAALEKKLTAPLSPNYSKLLSAARAQVRDKD